jgi:cytochrome c biogenesis protein CcmG, thiol:disulfide interchange protein DsbE
MKRWLPFAAFCILLVFLYVGLFRDPREVPSPFIGRPAPVFSLPVVERPGETFSPEQARGRPWLLNVWAPWCTTCQKEHLFLMQIAAVGVPVYGLNWKDADREAAAMLVRMGNPYVLNADDRDGRVGIDWGVTGVPETFVIDAEGIIRLKHSGPINERIWKRKLAPLLQALDT